MRARRLSCHACSAERVFSRFCPIGFAPPSPSGIGADFTEAPKAPTDQAGERASASSEGLTRTRVGQRRDGSRGTYSGHPFSRKALSYVGEGIREAVPSGTGSPNRVEDLHLC
jgi:hypothetical protein